jgi:NADP-dependent aldehyde dehydrogenase
LRSVELPRTTNQIRQAAAACRDRSWCRATIDSKNNIRSKHGPLGGPVVIFGPNNFPFAFNPIGGGDFATAIASGNPVIAKSNPGHPGTSRIIAETAFDVLEKTGLPKSLIQLIYHILPEDGLKLVGHPLVGATAFTGSRTAGLKLKRSAEKAGRLIYLEMSSLNPVIILPGALEEKADQIASELFSSCAAGAGQFCTKPGLAILLDNENAQAFALAVKELLESSPPGILLGRQIVEGIQRSVNKMARHGAKVMTGGQESRKPGFRFANSLLRTSGEIFLKHPEALQTEAFGTVSLLVFAKDGGQMRDIVGHLEGNLTGAIYSHSAGQDDALYKEIEPILRQKVGRLLNDKMPTGVVVTPAMAHTGPYPATGHPGFTSVGIPAALLRFTALHCYDNVRPHRLPDELKDKNPTGRMWRLIDGEWTIRDV